MIQQLKNLKGLKRKQIIKNKQVYLTEEKTLGNAVFFLFENEEKESMLNATYDFKLSGYDLELADEEDPNCWTINLPPGETLLRKVVAKKRAPEKAPGIHRGAFGCMMGGINPMSGIIDQYERVERDYSYKVIAEME